MTAPTSHILYFDGVCGLCNHSVDFVLKRDREHSILFAPLQGETAAQELPAEDVHNLSTIIFQTPHGLYRRSAAVVRILWTLGGIWAFWGALLWLVPLPLRNLGYRAVSATRYKVFGKKETCRIPTPEERDRFLP